MADDETRFLLNRPEGRRHHIRARERADLERMLVGIEAMSMLEQGTDYKVILVDASCPEPEIIETPSNDYRFRSIVSQAYLERVMAWLTRTCDHPNFKAQIDSDPAQRRKPYHEVWAVIARALGAYGRKGEA